MLTQSEKRERLRQLPAEVPDLHDWLHVLFKKIPNIVYVEYTHGREEFGADFVLEVNNPTIGRTEFVGVIAKKGTIKQGADDVERQIRECGIPRVIKNGKDEQSLPLIWVISNESVTSNAERKIRHQYRQYAIHFFSADDLIRWTDERAPYLWEDLPSQISQYLQGIRLGLEDLNRSANLLGDQLPDLKLDLELTPVDPDTYRKRTPSSAVSLFDEVKLRNVIFVEGQMGAGKSDLLRSLGLELCRAKSFNSEKTLPVFASYRSLMETHKGSLRKLIDASLGELISEYQEGRAIPVLIIDGLDEFSAEEVDESPLTALVSEVETLEGVKLVVSCRSGVIPRAIIRTTPKVRHLEVRPLTIRKISQFLKAVCQQAKLSNRMARDIGKSELFKQLPQNPIAALLLTRLMLQAKSRDELPQTLTELYSKALELMLGRWDIEKGLGSQQEYEVARRICGDIANYMIENRVLEIGITEIKLRVEAYLKERNLEIDSNTLLERLYSRSGVLIRNHSSGTVSFKHRSFAEFFCAEEWLRTNALKVDSRALESYWATVYFFCIGQRSDCESTLEQILSLVPTTDEHRLGKLAAAPTYLLAGHMTPYRVVESWFPNLMMEAAKYYLDVSSKRVDSVLAVFPPVPLLYVLQFYLRERYGYSFFRKAIDGAALAIADSKEDREVKAYALFLLGVIGIEVDYPEAFRFLVENYKASDLPIGLGAVVRVESERAQPKRLIPVVRAFNKRVYNMLKTSRALRNTLENAFKRPINPKAADKYVRALEERTSTRRKPV